VSNLLVSHLDYPELLLVLSESLQRRQTRLCEHCAVRSPIGRTAASGADAR
jgi:hypothetical protein